MISRKRIEKEKKNDEYFITIYQFNYETIAIVKGTMYSVWPSMPVFWHNADLLAAAASRKSLMSACPFTHSAFRAELLAEDHKKLDVNGAEKAKRVTSSARRKLDIWTVKLFQLNCDAPLEARAENATREAANVNAA